MSHCKNIYIYIADVSRMLFSSLKDSFKLLTTNEYLYNFLRKHLLHKAKYTYMIK